MDQNQIALTVMGSNRTYYHIKLDRWSLAATLLNLIASAVVDTDGSDNLCSEPAQQNEYGSSHIAQSVTFLRFPFTPP